MLTPTASVSRSAEPRASQNDLPADYKSRNFLVHTDLPKEDAEALLLTMETMLKMIARYWGAPSRRTIECFVVDNPDNWPGGSLPAPVRPIVVQNGITIAQGTRRGNQYNLNAIVYASNRFGTPRHEAVHAYCYQTFGITGPTWYAEGMAEMGNYWVPDDPTVTAPDYVLQFLKNSPRPTVEQITDDGQQTGDGWQNYAWRWALCHFLVNNENYQDRFRALGVRFLTQKSGTFQGFYGSQMDELKFEFDFLVNHLQRGFSVHRCSWDWRTRFREQKGTRPLTARIRADRGWQSSGLKVKKGREYYLSAEGTWKTSEQSDQLSAAGHSDGSGSLVGCVFHDYQLSEPFPLGVSSKFEAVEDGQLLLRCRDDWNALDDNEGTMTVELMSAENQ